MHLRRLWPPKQDGLCANGHLILGERWRRPCPQCGELRRIFHRFATETLGAVDKPN